MKLNERQMLAVKGLEKWCECFANQIYRIIVNHGLDKLKGFEVQISVDPARHYSTMCVDIGREIDSEAGMIRMVRGRADEKFYPVGKNSAEYELLFADEATRERMEKVLSHEKPLPPDGLWIGNHADTDPVDGWEWDLNDSLS